MADDDSEGFQPNKRRYVNTSPVCSLEYKNVLRSVCCSFVRCYEEQIILTQSFSTLGQL